MIILLTNVNKNKKTFSCAKCFKVHVQECSLGHMYLYFETVVIQH